jgi:hypothetical protein
MAEIIFLILKDIRNQRVIMKVIGIGFILVLSVLVCAISCSDSPAIVELPKVDLQKKIQGTWKVYNSTYLPIEHSSFCKYLMLNSIFEFLPDSTLVVRDTMNAIPCNRDLPQRYFVKDSIIKFMEWDMMFDYTLLRLTSDSLKFRINRIPSMMYVRDYLDTADHKREVEFYKKNGIVVSLVRIN